MNSNSQMKKIMILMILLITMVTVSAQTKRQLFDFGWQFTHNGKTVSMCLVIFATSLLYILMDFCLQVALIVVWKIYWQPVHGQ